MSNQHGGLRLPVSVTLLLVLGVASQLLAARDGSLGVLHWVLFCFPIVVFVVYALRLGSGFVVAPTGLPLLVVIATTSIPAVTALRPGAELEVQAWGRTIAFGVGPSMVIVAAGFALGAVTTFGGRPRRQQDKRELDLIKLRRLAKVFLTLASIFYCYRLLGFELSQRGVGQVERTVLDSVNVALQISVVVAITLLLVANAGSKKILNTVTEWIQALLPGLAVGATGARSLLVVSMLVLVAGIALKSQRSIVKTTVLLGGAVGALVLILLYRTRTTQIGFERVYEATAGSIKNSIALTMTYVPADSPFRMGETVAHSVINLIPSPIIAFLGWEGTESGASAFRNIIDFRNSNSGLGYSLAAEGYLNFGVSGMVAFSGVLGLSMAYLWQRASLKPTSALDLLYVALFAVFPSVWRADSLALFKTSVYTLILFAGAMMYARKPSGDFGAMSANIQPELSERVADTSSKHIELRT
jgi:hypothetical protein